MSFKQKKIKFKPRIKLNHNIFVATLFYFSGYCSLYLRVETHEGLKSATLMCLLCPILVIIIHCSHHLSSHWLKAYC